MVLAIVIGGLDLRYQDSHPEMDGDLLFAYGLFGRILLVNIVLLPVSIVAAWISGRRGKRRAA